MDPSESIPMESEPVRASNTRSGPRTHRSPSHGRKPHHGYDAQPPPADRTPETPSGSHHSRPAGQRVGGSRHRHGERTAAQPEESWMESMSAVTGTMSEAEFSVVDSGGGASGKRPETGLAFKSARYFGTFLAGLVVGLAFLSPVLMVAVPKLGLKPDWPQDVCKPDCEGLLIGLTFKLLILLLGTWALFFRTPKATMPRVYVFRALVIVLVFLLTFAYWLFYIVRILSVGDPDYPRTVAFAVSLVDALLFVHYLAVVLIELRQNQPQFVVKILRSPDGESRSYKVGQLSIQRLAVWCLEQYYCDFTVYNPYLERIGSRSSHHGGNGSPVSEFKVYNVDSVMTSSADMAASQTRAMIAMAAHRRDSQQRDRFYDELEYERRVAKRRGRLVGAVEEAFSHIRHLQQDEGKQ